MHNGSDIDDTPLSCISNLADIIGSLFGLLFHLIKLAFAIIYFIASHIVEEIIATEQMFLLMTNFYSFICQFFFFTLCDVTILNQELRQRPQNNIISGLTTLLLYSVVTYVLQRVQFVLTHVRPRTIRNTYRIRDMIFWVLRTLLQWAKAIIIVICLREQGLRYDFHAVYAFTTIVYFICTEKIYVDAIIECIKLFSFARLDSLEHLYVPVILHCISITMTIILVGYLLSTSYTRYALLSSYFTLYLPIKDLIWNFWNPLVLEQRTFATFKVASDKDITQWDDICAVCLDRMSRARITPCNHLFHPQCLKRCLQTSYQCPLCKRNFVGAELAPE